MESPRRCFGWDGAPADTGPLLTREWLVTNGLGGYASGTVAGVPTRRYHGWLVAALPGGLGRRVMLNHLNEEVRLPDGRRLVLGGFEHRDELAFPGAEYLREFCLENGLPVWRYAAGDAVIEKRLLLVHRQNTVHLQYRLIACDGPIRLRLRPSLHFRGHEGRVDDPIEPGYTLTIRDDRYEIAAETVGPVLRLRLHGEYAAFTAQVQRVEDVYYRVEARRGYDAFGTLWSPGRFGVDLRPDTPATLVATTEDWVVAEALSPEEAVAAEQERRRRLIAAAAPALRTGPAAELVLAADQFVIVPTGRPRDAARAAAAGDEVRTVIAGYHWFTDWGRDTMISLPGLTLPTGRAEEAGYILRTFAQYVRDGLIPNLFPEGQNEGLYHTADATLWFFEAIHHYLAATCDRATLDHLLPVLLEIARCHERGTRFGIVVDPADGLLRQGAPDLPLTWMDAKVEGWVVTPRRGKAVEINALWYNALRLLAGWLGEAGQADDAAAIGALAERAWVSFNERFWAAERGHLYDIVDGEAGDDPACRPNQIFALALTHPILDKRYWQPMVQTVQERLLTPVGLRSLTPGEERYQPRYDGDLRARDAAYHQGTIWGWLIGPFIDAWLRVHPAERERGFGFLAGLVDHLNEAGTGTISEIFDAEPPFTPRGCIAQAWSVAEVLRCWAKLSSS